MKTGNIFSHELNTWSLCAWDFHLHFFSSVMIVAREHSPVLVQGFGGVRAVLNKSQKLFRAKSYIIGTLLLCDWAVQQSANKPQTQKEKNVVRL